MSCDIHLHVEVKINGKWENWATPYISQNYALFTLMAGVRDAEDHPRPIALPRGLPADVSTVTAFHARHWKGDGHRHSWLSATEAGEVQEWYECIYGGSHLPPLFGYVFGNDVDSHVRFPEDCEELRRLGFEDVRVVFWFDN